MIVTVCCSATLLAACVRSPISNATTAVESTPERILASPKSLVEAIPTQISPSAAWIEIDVAAQTILLHEGDLFAAEYSVSTGMADNPNYSTPAGVYKVQSKEKGPVESVPGVFVTDIIMFDIYRGNGIHSRPMDADGKILDETLGQPSTAGCVRVGESAAVFEFAQLGMWIWIH